MGSPMLFHFKSLFMNDFPYLVFSGQTHHQLSIFQRPRGRALGRVRPFKWRIPRHHPVNQRVGIEITIFQWENFSQFVMALYKYPTSI